MSAGHQADAVFQGGGVKGLALVGALLEFSDAAKHPAAHVQEWVNVAGTSAGAIIAAYLACGHGADDTRALVETAPFPSFQDWGRGGEILGGVRNLLGGHGLAHGTVFRDWFDSAVAGQTFGDITTAGRTLKLISADITRREMLVLPDDLAAYRLPDHEAPIDPAAFPVADAVRMSMSIPYFFAPITLTHHETGEPSTVVDGGVLSNFPVWIFDVADRDPTRPTFGFKLVGGRTAGSGFGHVLEHLGWPVAMGADIFHTASDAWDKRWASHSTTVRTCTVSAGTVGTTDFNLTGDQRAWLLNSGHEAAAAFLDTWDPGQYVNRRGRTLTT